MRGFALLAAFSLIASCSDGDEFGGGKNQILIEGFIPRSNGGEVSLLAALQFEKSCFSGRCVSNCYWVINGKCCISSENLGVCNIKGYLWIIDSDTIPPLESPRIAGYGEHLAELVLVDAFGDSASHSAYIRIDEPLRIALLSPVENYEAPRNAPLAFQYRISGIDAWEAALEDTVYVSADEKVLEDETLLWEEGKALGNKYLEPPLRERAYYWGVKASNQDTAFYSGIRSVWVKN